MPEQLSNNAITTLAANIGYADATLTVASSSGFPSPNFRIVIDTEIILVTAVSGTSWTIVRGQESTSAAGHTAGASVANVLTVAGLTSAIGSATASTISGSIAESQVTGLTTDLGNKVATSTLGAANGVATLNGSGQLTSSQVPTALVGAVNYQGLWNASTNSPTLVSSTGSKGNYYVVSTAGTTTIDGNSQWNVGDTIIFNGSVWDKIDGVSSEVVSVAGRTGAVVLSASDVSSVVATSTTISTTTPLTGGGALSGNLTLGVSAATSSTEGVVSVPASGGLTISGGAIGVNYTGPTLQLNGSHQLYVSPANAINPGTLSSAFFTLLTNATPDISDSTIVTRDSSGNIGVNALTCNEINTFYASPNTIGETGYTTYYGDGSNLTGIGGGGGGGATTAMANDTGSGLDFSAADPTTNVYYGFINFEIWSGTITLPTPTTNTYATLVIDNTNSDGSYQLNGIGTAISAPPPVIPGGTFLSMPILWNENDESLGWFIGSSIYSYYDGVPPNPTTINGGEITTNIIFVGGGSIQSDGASGLTLADEVQVSIFGVISSSSGTPCNFPNVPQITTSTIADPAALAAIQAICTALGISQA